MQLFFLHNQLWNYWIDICAEGDMENNCCTDAVGQSSDDGRLLRSSSYEDIYVGTKLPGDEPSDDKDYSFDVSDIGDRFDSRPTCAAFLKQLGRRSSSFENLYEMQKREPEFAGDRNEVEDDSESFCMQPWQIRDSSEDFGEKDYVLAPIPSLIGEAQKNFPIDITVESGLDRVGQSAGYTTKRSSSHLLQHSMSYDLDPDKRHCKISSGSSLDGNDDGIDLQREQNAASGIGNGCRMLGVMAQCSCFWCRVVTQIHVRHLPCTA